MRAAVYGHHGVHIEEVERPVPGDDEVLLKVHAASLNAPDWRVMSVGPLLRRLMFAIAKTRRPGRDVAGIVEAAGRKITQFKPGDAVFGCASGSCADYACAREAWLVPKPETISFEQAACVAVSGLTALQGLRDKGKLQPGQTVLINGGTGAVGTFAVQIAKALGGETTAVCSTRNVDLVRSLGADHVIDYSKEDFTKSSQRYDVIFDVVGNRSLSSCGRLLTPTGSFVMVGGPKKAWAVLIRALTAFVRSRLSSRFRMFMARLRKDDLAALTDLITAGKVTPAIDRSYPLGNIAEAMQYAGKGHSRAKVVITM